MKYGGLAIVMLCSCVAACGQDVTFRLGEIVVSGASSKDAPIASVAVVDRSEMDALGAQTVDQAVLLVPGVNVQSGGKSAQHINIRGFSESELKVLVDGIPANETYFRTVDLSQFPVEGISRIKVIKGIPSVLYGANSMGGVVNIVTRQGGEEPSASGQMLFSDYSTMHAAVSGGGSLSNLNVFAAYAYQTSDGYRLSDDFDPNDADVGEDSPYHEDGGVRDNSDYMRRSLMGKVGFDTPGSQLYLSFDWHDDERGIPVEYNRCWRYSEWKQWHLNLAGEQQVGDDVLMKARVYYFKHDDTLEDDAEKTVAMGGRSWFDESVYDDYSLGGMLRSDWDMNEVCVWRGAVNYQFEQNRQRELNPKSGSGAVLMEGWTGDAVYETELWDFALENEWQLDQWIGLLGVSYDLYRPLRSTDVQAGDSSDALNPQVGLRYSLTDETEMSVGVGRKTRFPHMKELYSRQAGGNPDLDPEFSDSCDAGIESAYTVNGRPVSLTASLFYNDIHDMILSVEMPDGDPLFQNIGRAVTRGVELGGMMEPMEGIRLGLNYTWLDAQDEDLDRRLPQLPRNRINGSIRWQVLKNTALFSQGVYANNSVQYLYDRDTRSDRTRELPDYVLWNAGLEQALCPYATLLVRVDNLLDEDYDLGDGPMPGRRCWVGARVDW